MFQKTCQHFLMLLQNFLGTLPQARSCDAGPMPPAWPRPLCPPPLGASAPLRLPWEPRRGGDAEHHLGEMTRSPGEHLPACFPPLAALKSNHRPPAGHPWGRCSSSRRMSPARWAPRHGTLAASPSTIGFSRGKKKNKTNKKTICTAKGRADKCSLHGLCLQ